MQRGQFLVELPVGLARQQDLLHGRLGLRYDRTEQTRTALLTLVCDYTCFKILVRGDGL
jgi:hypothetical protein